MLLLTSLFVNCGTHHTLTFPNTHMDDRCALLYRLSERPQLYRRILSLPPDRRAWLTMAAKQAILCVLFSCIFVFCFCLFVYLFVSFLCARPEACSMAHQLVSLSRLFTTRFVHVTLSTLTALIFLTLLLRLTISAPLYSLLLLFTHFISLSTLFSHLLPSVFFASSQSPLLTHCAYSYSSLTSLSSFHVAHVRYGQQDQIEVCLELGESIGIASSMRLASAAAAGKLSDVNDLLTAVVRIPSQFRFS
jgi:hypothetical protein